MRVTRHTLIVLLGWLLAGCGATATPVAVFEGAVVPTRQPTQTPAPTIVSSITQNTDGGLGFVFPAENGGMLTLGDHVTGSIDSENYAQIYTFEGLAGQRIDISMSGAGNLDTYLILLAPDGREITRNDDRSDTSSDAQLRDVDLEDSGIYTIVATVWRQRYTRESGDYRLELSEAQESDAPPSPRTKFISYGVTQYDDITDRSYWDAYTFRGTAGDIIDVMMHAEDGENPDTSLAITDSYGNEIAHNEDVNPLDNFDATIYDFQLPYTGYYTVMASRYEGKSGTSSGDYELTVELIGQVDPAGFIYAYQDTNQSVSLFDVDNMGFWDFGYHVGDASEVDGDGVEWQDTSIQTILTYYLPPITGNIENAMLDLSTCATEGSDFDAIGGIDVYLDDLDGRIRSETPFEPSETAQKLVSTAGCTQVDLTEVIQASYENGVSRLQFRLIPQTTAENNTDDLVVFLNPRLEMVAAP